MSNDVEQRLKEIEERNKNYQHAKNVVGKQDLGRDDRAFLLALVRRYREYLKEIARLDLNPPAPGVEARKVISGCHAPIVGDSAEESAVRPPEESIAAKPTNEKHGEVWRTDTEQLFAVVLTINNMAVLGTFIPNTTKPTITAARGTM